LTAQSFSPASLTLPCLGLLAALATACSFDASRLRSTSPNPDGADERMTVGGAVSPDSNGGTAAAADAPAGAPDAAGVSDAPVDTGGGDSIAATGGVGGSDSASQTGGATSGDAATAAGGAIGSDVPQASGGNGSGGVAETNDTASPSGGVVVTGAFGGSASGGANGGTTLADGGVGSDASGVGGNAGSGGQTSTGGIGGGGGAPDAANSGGQPGTGGGSGGSAADAASDAASCVAQCPATATIGITGPWGATYSNGSSGAVVASGDSAFLTWLASRGPNCVVQNLDISGNNYLTAARLAPYQIIVVLDIYHTQADKNAFFNAKITNTGYPAYPGTQRTILTSEVNAVRDWVNNGGGLMTTIGTTGTAAEMTNANLLLNPFGIAYSVTDVNILPGNSPITMLVTAPPIASQITAGVSALRVTGAVGIEGLAGGNLPQNSSTFSLYASGGTAGRGGYVAYAIGVAKIVGGVGHVNVWGDETITYDMSWNTSAYDTQTYWTNVLTWLGQCP
jgi:hypothetical protein